jgi:aryl-alcohol dehydrogenase-like predicted oxidoreductase
MKYLDIDGVGKVSRIGRGARGPGAVRWAPNQLFGTENLRRVEPLLQTLRDVAAEVGAKPAQVALAWLISLPNVVAIPAASSVEQLEFNVAAADIELGAQSRDALTSAARAFRPVSTVDFFRERVQEKLGRR